MEKVYLYTGNLHFMQFNKLFVYIITGDQYQTPSFKMVIVRPKMDLNRALRIMGYSSAREFMDTAKDESKKPKEELDKKHFAQSMLLMKKKQKGQDVSLKRCMYSIKS